MATLLHLFAVLLPWPLRRALLCRCFGYEIHPTARIGLSLVRPRRLRLEAQTRIGHLTVCIHLDLLHLKEHATIGRGNWITGFPTGPSPHFAHQPERRSELIVGEHTAITNRHLIDCTGGVTLGRFTTFAGFGSQILTHSIDLVENRQSSAPVTIGDYCFIGTDCVLLGGSGLPDRSVLGAKSLLNKKYEEEYTLFAGTPARPIQAMPRDARYFHRTEGMVF